MGALLESTKTIPPHAGTIHTPTKFYLERKYYHHVMELFYS